MKPNYFVIPPTPQHQSFFRNLAPLRKKWFTFIFWFSCLTLVPILFLPSFSIWAFRESFFSYTNLRLCATFRLTSSTFWDTPAKMQPNAVFGGTTHKNILKLKLFDLTRAEGDWWLENIAGRIIFVTWTSKQLHSHWNPAMPRLRMKSDTNSFKGGLHLVYNNTLSILIAYKCLKKEIRSELY